MMSIAIVPAAGAGRRFGSSPKLLAPIDGVPLLQHTLRSLLDAGLTRIVVVIAPGAELPGVSALDDARVTTAVNPDPSRGMLSSIQAGIAGIAVDDLNAARSVVVIHPGDMPFVAPDTIRRVIEACRDGGRVVCPAFKTARGHPVVMPGAMGEAIRRAPDGATLAALLDAFPGGRTTVDVDDPGVVRDVDVPGDL
jgi:molybdenum cofactor cytidylyltransferase